MLKKTKIRSEHAPQRESELLHNHTFDYVSLDFSVNSHSHSCFSRQSSIGLENFPTHPYFEKMDNKMHKELVVPDVTYQPLCIQYPKLDDDFELKSGLIHLLPKFHGLAEKDPHKHLKEFHVVYSTMKPHGIDVDYIKLIAFPFSLDGRANELFLHSSLSYFVTAFFLEPCYIVFVLL